jgi:MFS family permease
MPGAERSLRRNFGFDAVGAVGTGLVNALIVNFIAVIARREGADAMLLAALAAAPFAANTLGIFCGFWVPSEGGRVRYVSALLILGRSLFLFAVFTTGPVSLLLMSLGMWLTLALASPLQVDIWRGTYPQRVLGRVLGYLRVLQTSAGAIGAPLGGFLIDLVGSGPMLGVGAALGILGAAGYSQVQVQTTQTPAGVASQRFGPMTSLRLLAGHANYRNLSLAWVVWGFGAVMASPLYALVLVDQFQASYADVGLLQLASSVCGLLAYFVLGHLLDRRGSGAWRAYVSVSVGLVLTALIPLFFLYSPNLIVLGIGYVLLGVGNSAVDLGWQIALIARVPNEHRLPYQGAHTSITGIRGAVAPFFGSLILGLGFGFGPVLVLSGALGLIGAALMAREFGVAGPVRGAQRRAQTEARADRIGAASSV